MTLMNTGRLGGLVAAAGLVWAVGLPGVAIGQSTKLTPAQRRVLQDPNIPLKDKIIMRGRTEHWVLKIDLFYPGLSLDTSIYNNNGVIRPEFNYPGRTLTPEQWDKLSKSASGRGVAFESGAMVFPVPMSTAAHSGQTGTFRSELSLDGREIPVQPIWTDNYQSGTRLGRWEMKSISGNRLKLHLDIPMTCWETFYVEEEANKIDWPAEPWSGVAKSALEPVYLVEWANDESEIATTRARLDEVVNRWMGGRDPKSIKPAVLAKEIAGRTLELCTPGRGSSEFGNMTGTFRGVLTSTVPEMLNLKRVNDLDPPVMLAAIYRHVGIPARTVYGYDMADREYRNKSNQPNKLHCWVEFALMDPQTKAPIWIPVDVVKMRWNGSRMQNMDRAWEYFGKNEDLAWTLPISFQVHPPTNVYVRSLPAFWGWLCTPETPPYPHTLTIDAVNQNSRDLKKNNPDKR